MQGFQKVNLLDLIEEIGEEKTLELLENFSCPPNADVEDFLKHKSITFARQRLASVWLIFASFKDEWCFCAYFALTQKHFHIDLTNLSSNLRSRIKKFANYNSEIKKYVLVAPLIGQLGKNFNFANLITGDELLKIACDTVKQAQRILGGRIVYLEAEDVPALIDFYQRNGFFNFGRRKIDSDEKLNGKSLVQFLKYL